MQAVVKDKLIWNRDGRLFTKPQGYGIQSHDLSDVKILSRHVDTYKQMYSGLLNSTSYQTIREHVETNPDKPLKLRTFTFKVSRSGSKSGYRFILKNLDLGVVILYGSFYKKINDFTNQTDEPCNQLKIECSPHLLVSQTARNTQKLLDNIAHLLLKDYEPIKPSIHLAVDFQGWQIPDDFEKRFVCRSTNIRRYNSMDKLDMSLNTFVARYGRGQSIMWGSNNSLQGIIYNKIDEAQTKGKKDFWQTVWRNKNNGYDDKQIVNRIEFRFSPDMIKQISDYLQDSGSINYPITNFVEINKLLTSLFVFALTKQRLNSSSRYIDPFWQLLMQDVLFNDQPVLDIKRKYTKSVGALHRNITAAVGHVIAICAKKNWKEHDVRGMLSDSGLWTLYEEHVCTTKGNYGSKLWDEIIDRYHIKKLEGHCI